VSALRCLQLAALLALAGCGGGLLIVDGDGGTPEEDDAGRDGGACVCLTGAVCPPDAGAALICPDAG